MLRSDERAVKYDKKMVVFDLETRRLALHDWIKVFHELNHIQTH
jgi:hypothetical protein